MDKNNIEAIVNDEYLTIKGEKREEKNESVTHYKLKKISYGKFKRTIKLDSSVTIDKITSQFKNGTLVIVAPKKERVMQFYKRLIIEG